MRSALLLVVLLVTGCASQGELRAGAGASAAQSSLGVRIEPGRAAGALIGLGLFAAALRSSALAHEGPIGTVHELDPTRRVHLQDCTQPLEDPGANLRCR